MERKKKNASEQLKYPLTLPLVPVRDMVLVPGQISPILVGRPESVRALDEAQSRDKLVVVVAQKDDELKLKAGNLHEVATVGRILQILRQEETVSMLVEGVECVDIGKFQSGPYHSAVVTRHQLENDIPQKLRESLRRSFLRLLADYVSGNPRASQEVLEAAEREDDDEKLFYLGLASLSADKEDKARLLGASSLSLAIKGLMEILNREIECRELERGIMGKVRHRLDEQQKSYFLNEQIRAIEQELGKKGYSEADEYYARFDKVKLPKAVKAAVEQELQKLDHMAPFSPESTVVRNYLDWILDIPWNKTTKDKTDLKEARAILDRTHYGLKEPKERVLEYLAVRSLRGAAKEKEAGEESVVLCLTGPPGVGKTTLAKSVAEALGRKFVRISLGGVSDEAEIRGHRRTYIGSMPGRIVQALKKAGTMNPVILLDEIDKLGSDWRGDPTAALLEILDPEQNTAFNDHFLEVDLDLSKVVFLCTSNVWDAIHPTLRDRMETIELSSYTEGEKLAIARTHLLEKQRAANGLPSLPDFDDEAVLHIIRDYTCESGVRQLDREIAKVMRKLATEIVAGRKPSLKVDAAVVRKLLGVPRQFPDLELPPAVPGVALGLAWTEVGGATLKIEATAVKGKGDLLLTGQLGDVMQESAKAALTYIRKIRPGAAADEKYFAEHDIHIHVPEGAIPKDGPSAGITLACALYSLLTGQPLARKLAMTGEITLTGLVLPIGGVKEKFLAAHRAGVRTVILPRRCEAELEDVPKEVLAELDVHRVDSMEEVLAIAFPGADKPAPRTRAKRSGK